MDGSNHRTYYGLFATIICIMLVFFGVGGYMMHLQITNATKMEERLLGIEEGMRMYSGRYADRPESYELFGKKIPNGRHLDIMDDIFNRLILTNRDATKDMVRIVYNAQDRVELIHRLAEEKGAPKDILYLFVQESRLYDRAKSPAAAEGSCQFIRSTADLYGLEIVPGILDERRSFPHCVRASFEFFEDILQGYVSAGIDTTDTANLWYLVGAGYNHGPGRVLSKIRRTGTSDYFEFRSALPYETQWYIPHMAIKKDIIENHESYGIDMSSTTTSATICLNQVRVEVTSPISAYQIAIDSLRFMNLDYGDTTQLDLSLEANAIDVFLFCNPQIILKDTGIYDELPVIDGRPYYDFNVPERPITVRSY